MKKTRQDRILFLIEEQDIETQEELARQLQLEGYSVTQATVSRDIKSLQLTKMQKHGKMVYQSLLKESPERDLEKFVRVMRDGTVSMAVAGNILVIKTLSGMANGVAMAIDQHHFSEVVGSLAGDDTIFCVTSGEKDSQALKDSIENLMRG